MKEDALKSGAAIRFVILRADNTRRSLIVNVSAVAARECVATNQLMRVRFIDPMLLLRKMHPARRQRDAAMPTRARWPPSSTRSRVHTV